MGRHWLLHPVTWHSSRIQAYPWKKMSKHQIELVRSRFINWYTSDWTYGHGTIYFWCAAIGCYLLGNLFYRLHTYKLGRGKINDPREAWYKRFLAIARYFGSRQFSAQRLGYYSPPLNAVLGVVITGIFFLAFALARHPYWLPSKPVVLPNGPPLAFRASWIAIGTLPFVIAFSTKVNYVGLVTGTSHEKLQVYHRWGARFIWLLAMVHGLMYIHWNIHIGTMKYVWHNTPFFWTGTASLVSLSTLVFLSAEPIRVHFYETFKKLHFITACFFMSALFVHTNYRLTSWDYIWASLALYSTSWLIRTFYMTLGNGINKRATFEALPSNMVRIVIPANDMRWKPGQHFFVRFLSLGVHAFSSHPFTAASIPTKKNGNASLELLVRGRNGITGRIGELALSSRMSRVLIDGPYGGIEGSMRIYDRVLLIAGGTGATFIMPVLFDLALGFEEGMNCKQIELVWVVASSDDMLWFSSELARLIQTLPETDLNVSVYVTESSGAKIEPKSFIFDVQRGRPNLALIIEDFTQQLGNLGIATCGPESMTYQVRNTVAARQLDIASGKLLCKEIFLHTESFSW